MRSLRANKPSGKRGTSSRVIEFAALESRTLMCGYHAAAGGGIISLLPGHNSNPTPNNYPTLNVETGLTVPQYNSLPGAAATLYLDFDGDAARQWGSYSVPATPAYNIDGNASTFSAQERANIAEIWKRVAEKFSVFNINVTTVRPANFDNGKGLQVVIGGNGSWMTGAPGGVSYVGSFSNSAPNTAYAFTVNLGNGYAKYVGEAIAHESGHAFGLQHQSTFDGPDKVSEYSTGNGTDAPTMGNSYGAVRGMWWYGTNTNGTTQDDLSILANATNGFGYRGDDFGSSPGTAKRLSWSNGKFNVKAMINNTNDRDYFRFDFTGGTLTLKLRGQNPGAMLDGWLRLYKRDGTLVKHVNNPDLSETIVRTLTPGTYYAVVFSNGRYGDVGQYALYGYDDVAGAPAVPGRSPVIAPAPTLHGVQSIAKALFSSKEIAGSMALESKSLV